MLKDKSLIHAWAESELTVRTFLVYLRGVGGKGSVKNMTEPLNYSPAANRVIVKRLLPPEPVPGAVFVPASQQKPLVSIARNCTENSWRCIYGQRSNSLVATSTRPSGS